MRDKRVRVLRAAGLRSGLKLAERLHSALRPGGLAVIEVYPHVAWRRMMDASDPELRVWHELPDDDPWRFYLSYLRLDGDTLTHRKTFVHRTDGTVDSGRREQLKLYTAESLAELLGQAGFAEVECFGVWEPTPWADDELLVVTARRP